MTRKTTNSPSHFEQLESRQLMSGGQLDATFGQAGKAAPALGFLTMDAAVQPDGKTVVVGQSGGKWMAARLTTSGALDPSFGAGNGLVSVTMPYGRVDQIALQSDGKIVLGGTVWNSSPFIGDKFALVRLTAEGAFDRTFAGDGKATAVGGMNCFVMSDLIIQPDGKLVFTGADRESHIGYNEADFVVARMLTNGAIDTTFGDVVVNQYTVSRKGWTRTAFGGHDLPTSIAIAPDGKIVVGGTRAGEDESGVGDHRFLVSRYNTNGTLDTSFDGDGKLSTSMGGIFDELNDIVIQSSGKIIAGGMAQSKFAMVRYNTNGSIDSSFGAAPGTNGRVYTRLSQREDVLKSLSIDSRGRIVAVGTTDRNYTLNFVGKRAGIAQYWSNGAIDTTFGNNGIATIETGNINVYGSTLATNTNKLTFWGYQGSDAASLFRVHQQIAKVDINDLDRTANESGADTSGSIRVSRDDTYNFPTRVYLDVQGSAIRGTDYNVALGTAKLITGKPGLGKIGLGDESKITFRNYIDIPAGSRWTDLPVTAIDDMQFENTEVAAFSIINDASYVRGLTNTAAVSISDGAEMLNVNFQADPFHVGPTTDLGAVFGARGSGLTFGWDADNTANARNRASSASPDYRYDSLNHMQKNGANRKWEIAVPNGMYDVRVVAGDPTATDSVYRINVENTLSVTGTPSGDKRWFRGTVRVNVTDGRITVSNAAGAVNNRICFIDIKHAPSGGIAGAVTSSLPVRQYGPSTASNWHRTPSGLFSDNQIDETIWA